MKKIGSGILMISILSLMSCNKSEGGNKSVIKEDIQIEKYERDGKIDSTSKVVKTTISGDQTTTESTYRYVASDGSSAHVSFIKTNDDEKISINSNKKTIKADLKSAENGKSVYVNGDITITSEGDLIKIEQGEQTIELKKARGI